MDSNKMVAVLLPLYQEVMPYRPAYDCVAHAVTPLIMLDDEDPEVIVRSSFERTRLPQWVRDFGEQHPPLTDADIAELTRRCLAAIRREGFSR